MCQADSHRKWSFCKLRKRIFERNVAKGSFEKDIADTRQLVKDIISNKREDAKTASIKYLSK